MLSVTGLSLPDFNVLLISFEITILSKSSTLRAIPVAYKYLSPYFTNYAVRICEDVRIILADLLSGRSMI